MTWFVASIISVIQMTNSEQEEFPVCEDFILLNAQSEEELQEKIRERMNLIEAAGDCFYLGEPAKQICLGARKIRSIYNEPPLDIDADPPGDGTELSHSFMVVNSLADAEMLAKGQTVTVRYIDNDDDDE